MMCEIEMYNSGLTFELQMIIQVTGKILLRVNFRNPGDLLNTM